MSLQQPLARRRPACSLVFQINMLGLAIKQRPHLFVIRSPSAGWARQAKPHTTQLGNLQTFCVPLVVILHQTGVEIFDSADCTYMRYSFAFCSRSEALIDIISGLFIRQSIAHKAVNFNDPRLNRCREIRPNPSQTAFSTDFCRDNSPPDAVSDVVSGVAVDLVGMDVRVKSGDSTSYRS